MSPLVSEALKCLTVRVNLDTGILHYSDESAAKDIFRLLHKEGESLIASEITKWAMANGWKTKDAQQLGALAEKIGRGGKVVVRDKNQWREDIIEQLRTRANDLGA